MRGAAHGYTESGSRWAGVLHLLQCSGVLIGTR
jgi:hypothetical protein